MLSVEDTAWAAGLFEGEGCISRYRSGAKGGQIYQYPKIELVTTDRDVLVRFAEIVGGNTRPRDSEDNRQPHYKIRYAWSVAGYHKIRLILMVFWPWLGERRRERAVEILTMPMGRLEGETR